MCGLVGAGRGVYVRGTQRKPEFDEGETSLQQLRCYSKGVPENTLPVSIVYSIRGRCAIAMERRQVDYEKSFILADL